MTITANRQAAAPVFDPAAVRQWLGILHGDSPGHVHICSTNDWAGRIFGDLDAATKYVTYLDQQGREGIYLRVTTLRTDRAIGGRGGAADSAALPALWADLDLAGPGHAEQDLPPDEAAGRAVIDATGLPEPTIWVHSGGGLYPIWLLDQPHTLTQDNLDQAKQLAKDWQRIIEHAAASLGWRYGRGVGDLARVLRIPGTVNRKEGLARPCRIIAAIPTRYTVQQLVDALAAAMQRIAPAEPAGPADVGSALVGTPAGPRPDGQLAPGEDFNQRAEWPQILSPAGWREHYRSDDVTYWTRPGKPTGTSASTNALGTDRLYVFTTNADPLEGDESYSKFGAYCVAPDTKVLRADLTWAAAGNLVPGDGLVGVDEYADQKHGRRKLRLSHVELAERRTLPCYRVTLADGRSIVASAQHPWLAASAGKGGNLRWITMENLRPGQRICSITDGTWQTATDFDSGWLSGILDGEGWASGGKVGIAQKDGPVLHRARRLLEERGFTPAQHDRGTVHNLTICDLPSILRLLGTLQPGRLVAKLPWAGRGAWTQAAPDTLVVSIEFLGWREVAAFQTTTRTFIAEGLVSHNSALHFGGDHKAAARALGRQGYGSPLPDPATEQAAMIRDLIGHLDQPGLSITPAAAASAPPTAPPGAAAPRTPPRIWAPEVDVTNPAEAADWLREELGRSRLAGMFRRLDAVVHTPREGEQGYVPLTDADADIDGPAQVRPVNDSNLASRITYTYGCYRLVKKEDDFEKKQNTFPRTAARIPLDVPDMLPNLRPLRGVIHTPIVRPDGSLLEAPGYDQATGLLHLPEPGLVVPRVPEQPTDSDVRDAMKLLLEMIDGFPFVSEHFRANYLGALLTPLLRSLTPPPYKLHAIEAHQPGSGKTLLANLARLIHGGVFRAELPEDDAELRKQITAILSITTGPVVILDNVSGALKSSTLAGLLTTNLWDDRPLGSTSWTRSTNDRLWTVTGNNISIGGDLPRRTIRTVIDPGQPNPELRTGFAISNLEGWVTGRRGELLHALLTLVRAWVAAGKPLPQERASDSYALWVRTVESILNVAGIPGQFDHASTQVEVGTDDDEWSTFLAAVQKAYKDRVWIAKELLGDVDTGNLITPGLVPLDALPDELGGKAAKHPKGPVGISKSLGRWLSNREGRWAGGLVVRCVGKNHDDIKEWQIQTKPDRTEP